MDYILEMLQAAYDDNTMDNCPDDTDTHICRLSGAIQSIHERYESSVSADLDADLEDCGVFEHDYSGLARQGFKF